MSIWHRLLNRVTGWGGQPSESRIIYTGRTIAGPYITADNSLENATIWACVQYLTRAVGQLPWHAMLKVKGNASVQASHTVDYLLNKRPCPDFGSFSWRQTMLGNALLHGNGYAEIQWDNRGLPYALWPIHPDRVRPRRAENGELEYEVWNRGANVVLPAKDMFHIRGFGDGPVGYSVIEYAAQSIGWARATEMFGATYFGEGMNPSMIIETTNRLSLEGMAALREELEELYKGPKGKRTAILDAGMKANKIATNPDDSQFIETRQHQVEEICRWFGVPPHKVMHLLRATFCLPANTKVFTVQGPKRIADIQAGEAVWSRTDAGEWVQSTVEKSAPTGIDRILRLITTNRTLRLNARHRVLARRAHEVSLRDGEIGGRNVKGRKVRVEWRTEYVAAGDLRAGDTIVTLDRLPDVGLTTAPNGRRLTTGFMAFCGLLLGDGNVFAGSVSIARAATAAYMDAYREVMAAEFDAAANRGACGGVAGQRRPVLLREAERQTRFSSVAAAKELLALGFGGTARTKRVPGWVFELSEDLRLAFLAGFLDADGSVDKKGRMSFHSVSADLLDDMRHLCIGLGIPVTNARRAPVKTRLPNGEAFEGEISTFTCSDPGANTRVPTATPIYVERFTAGKAFGRKGRAYPRHGGAGFDELGCGLSRIVEIAEEHAEVVYDLSVQTTHNFVADGVVVHNSNIEHQSIEVVVDSVTPWVCVFEEEADYKLFGPTNRQGYYTKMFTQALLRGDNASRIAFYRGMFEMGMTINQILALEDLNGIGPDGDVVFVSNNVQTLERAIAGTPAVDAEPAAEAPAAKKNGALNGTFRH